MKIKFVINPWRKEVNNKFNPKLSKYWANQLYDGFKNW